jgi:hypothetical protein
MAAVAVLTAGVALAYASLGLVLHETVGDDAVLRLPSTLVDEMPQISYGPEPPEADAAAERRRERDGARERGRDGDASTRDGGAGTGARGDGDRSGGGGAGDTGLAGGGEATLRGLPSEQYPGGG